VFFSLLLYTETETNTNKTKMISILKWVQFKVIFFLIFNFSFYFTQKLIQLKKMSLT